MADVDDDGRHVDVVNPYAERKHRLLAHYAEMFARGMQKKYNHRIYLDLFASSGYARIKDESRIIETSPILALRSPVPFTEYVFCDLCTDKLEALRERVEACGTSAKVRYYAGDVNAKIDDVLRDLPHFAKGNTGLSLCFIDPYAAKNLRFKTIEKLAAIFVDFLVMIPSYIDLNRHQNAQYQKEVDSSFDLMVGTTDWRAAWDDVQIRRPGLHFGEFCVEFFGRRMQTLDYLPLDPGDIKLIDDDRWYNAPRYHITLFSRGQTGIDFWRKTWKNLDPQGSLF